MEVTTVSFSDPPLRWSLRPELTQPRTAADDSFNLIDTDISFKIDFFVLGDTLLDQRQLDRRILIPVLGVSHALWVTSPTDQVLRNLDWFHSGDQCSEQQWRDIREILRVGGEDLDLHDLESTAEMLGLDRLLYRALAGMSPEV